jgi:DNA repair exonuclease SbcCD ATPase subunit
MIESIKLKNFQVHRTLTVDFSRYVTTIVGPTDAGKSTILRALEWCCLNTPSSEYLRDDAPSVKVSLTVDGHTITRKKGKSNSYTLDGKTYKAIRSNVPPAIEKLLNVSPLNFQGQFEPHFWLSQTSGQVSKELNAIIDLSSIDHTMSFLGSRIRQVKAETSVVESRLNSAREDKKRLSFALRMKARFDDLDAQYDSLEAKAGGIELLGDLIDKVGSHTKTVGIDQNFVDYGKTILKQGDKLEKRQIRIDTLEQIIRSAKRLKNLRDAQIPSLTKLNDLASKINSLADLIDEIKTMKHLTNQRCPTCLKPLTPNH